MQVTGNIQNMSPLGFFSTSINRSEHATESSRKASFAAISVIDWPATMSWKT
jgi:hypothetical protein